MISRNGTGTSLRAQSFPPLQNLPLGRAIFILSSQQFFVAPNGGKCRGRYVIGVPGLLALPTGFEPVF